MKVDILMNPKARSANEHLIESKIRDHLFRCDLGFYTLNDVREMQKIIKKRVAAGTDFFIICGGDGTLNAAIQPLMALRNEKKNEKKSDFWKVPPVCLIPLGTANDLATEMGISKKVDNAARAILEGGIKLVDVLEIEADGKISYMITNGGIGIPARTAWRVNAIRNWIREKTEDPPGFPRWIQPVFRGAKKALQLAGCKVYEIMLVGDLASWDYRSWEVQIDVPGKTSFTTRAPFIMINNQPSVGGRFKPAPFTSNGDGTFNVLLIQSTRLLPQVRAILDIRLGRIPKLGICPSFETSTVKLKSVEGGRALTFFGDGEILHQNSDEISIRCIHPGIPVVTMEAHSTIS